MNLAESRSHTQERPSTVESLAVIYLAESDSPTYRIPDLHNGHGVTQYLLILDLSPLPDSFQSQ